MSRSDPVRQWNSMDHVEEACDLVEAWRSEREEFPDRIFNHDQRLQEAAVHMEIAQYKYVRAQRAQAARQ